MFNEKKISFVIGDKTVEVSTGKLAKQATASVVIKCLDTVLLATVTASAEPKEGADFFPLTVDFDEKLYSVGRIPGGYLRREGKASDKAVLISRLIDRPIRPLFPEGFRRDVQVTVITLSVDESAPPDTLAMLAASFALEISGLPFEGPLGAVRVSRNADGAFILNPTEAEQGASDLDIVVAGTKDSIMMVEAGAGFVPENIVLAAIEQAHEEIKKQVAKVAEFGKMLAVVKETFEVPLSNPELVQLVEDYAKADLIASMQNATKQSRKVLVDTATNKVEDALADKLADRTEEDPLVMELAANPNLLATELKKLEKKLLRKQILETGVRADGRKLDQVRPIYIEVGQYPRVHGDGLFTRGDTQVLSMLSLGTAKLARILDGIDSETEKFYMHNYNFPAWSVGEVRPNRGPGRREIGHGALAERALIPSLPDRETFPYAIRVVSEVLESSGSTSMASTCASSLALMDGGVPVSTPVAGIAMGLIHEAQKTVVLSDIHELEDFLGDMDFKVAGNQEGISALQMDIKIKGISVETMRKAIEQARIGRLHILAEMNKIISKPRSALKPNAPQVITLRIDTERIGAVIGPSGKNIKAIIEETGTDINIDDDGLVSIYTNNVTAGERAKLLIRLQAEGLKTGEIWDAKIVKIIDGVGAIAEVVPGASGLIHISQIANQRVNNVSDYLQVGDIVKVKVNGTDFKGRVSLSMKALLEGSAEETHETAKV
jgi:polyribonucleotide nucleotidyltransferase